MSTSLSDMNLLLSYYLIIGYVLSDPQNENRIQKELQMIPRKYSVMKGRFFYRLEPRHWIFLLLLWEF